jgi:hypothetical protein
LGAGVRIKQEEPGVFLLLDAVGAFGGLVVLVMKQAACLMSYKISEQIYHMYCVIPFIKQ